VSTRSRDGGGFCLLACMAVLRRWVVEVVSLRDRCCWLWRIGSLKGSEIARGASRNGGSMRDTNVRVAQGARGEQNV
jgi:hypothetical protein